MFCRPNLKICQINAAKTNGRWTGAVVVVVVATGATDEEGHMKSQTSNVSHGGKVLSNIFTTMRHKQDNKPRLVTNECIETNITLCALTVV